MKSKSFKFAAMTIQEANKHLLFQLYHLYGNSEAANIADLVMENITGWKRIDRVINKQVKLSSAMEERLEKYIAELSTHKPVQYVIGEAWFYDMKFFVNENVLIPRPETEELAGWIIESNVNDETILDIGTGSGCIPVALKKKLPLSVIYACDISKDVLQIAAKNATDLNAGISFIEADFLDRQQWEKLPEVNIIVSNPPYIPVEQKREMKENVIAYEPHLALFVDNEDPLIFYRAIAEFAELKLLPGGNVFVELHEDFWQQVMDVFRQNGFTSVEIKKDMQGKNRMLRANK